MSDMTLTEFIEFMGKENKYIKRVIRDGDKICIVELGDLYENGKTK